jgi:hypothetical protein
MRFGFHQASAEQFDVFFYASKLVTFISAASKDDAILIATMFGRASTTPILSRDFISSAPSFPWLPHTGLTFQVVPNDDKAAPFAVVCIDGFGQRIFASFVEERFATAMCDALGRARRFRIGPQV